MIFLIQRDENFAVGGRNRRDIALRYSGPAIGDSDVIDESIDLIAGITERISRSRAAKRISVSSMREPAGPRACRRIWPESTSGKKSSPTNATNPRDRTQKTEKDAEERAAMIQRPIEQAHIAKAELFELGIKEMVDPPEQTPATNRCGIEWRLGTSAAQGRAGNAIMVGTSVRDSR